MQGYMGSRYQTSANAQATQHDSTAHVQRLFPPKRKPDNHDIITMTLLSC